MDVYAHVNMCPNLNTCVMIYIIYIYRYICFIYLFVYLILFIHIQYITVYVLQQKCHVQEKHVGMSAGLYLCITQ